MTRISPALNPDFVKQQGHYGNSPQPESNARRGEHVVAWVKWPTGVHPSAYDGCKTACVCGWEGTVGEWTDHRLANAGGRRLRQAAG